LEQLPVGCADTLAPPVFSHPRTASDRQLLTWGARCCLLWWWQPASPDCQLGVSGQYHVYTAEV